MGRLVMLLILAAGLPGVLLGTGLALLAYGSLEILPSSTAWALPGGPMLAMALITVAVLLAATGTAARGRLGVTSSIDVLSAVHRDLRAGDVRYLIAAQVMHHRGHFLR